MTSTPIESDGPFGVGPTARLYNEMLLDNGKTMDFVVDRTDKSNVKLTFSTTALDILRNQMILWVGTRVINNSTIYRSAQKMRVTVTVEFEE